MFFVLRGAIAVLVDEAQENLVAVKRSGEYFGEITLILNHPRAAFCRAETFCVLTKLERQDFDHILSECPPDLLLNTVRHIAQAFGLNLGDDATSYGDHKVRGVIMDRLRSLVESSDADEFAMRIEDADTDPEAANADATEAGRGPSLRPSVQMCSAKGDVGMNVTWAKGDVGGVADDRISVSDHTAAFERDIISGTTPLLDGNREESQRPGGHHATDGESPDRKRRSGQPDGADPGPSSDPPARLTASTRRHSQLAGFMTDQRVAMFRKGRTLEFTGLLAQTTAGSHAADTKVGIPRAGPAPAQGSGAPSAPLASDFEQKVLARLGRIEDVQETLVTRLARIEQAVCQSSSQ